MDPAKQSAPLTPAEASSAAEAVARQFLTMRWDSAPGGVLLKPPTGRGRYVNVQVHLPGMELTTTIDTKDPGWALGGQPAPTK